MKQTKEINLDIKIQMVQFSDDKVTTIKTETRSDPVLSALLEIITAGWPEKRHKLSLPLRTYWGYRDELSVEDGIILKGGRIVIPTSMQKDILNKLHTPHMGMEKTKLRAKSSVFWPSINNDIEQVTRQCETCNSLAKSQRKEPLMPHEIPTRPWQNIGTDLMYFDNDNYIIVTDYYNKFPFVRKIKGQCTSNAVITILKEIFSEHRIPEIVISDNGRQYSSGEFKMFANQWGFKHVTSSPHFPQSNGLAERFVQTVKAILKKCKAENSDTELALLCLRTTPIDAEIPSPAELLYTRKIKANLPVKLYNPISTKDRVYQQLMHRQETQKMYHDRGAQELPPLIAKQPVYVQNETGK